jgi:hypothetical protein
MLFQMKFKNLNNLFAQIICYKLLETPSYDSLNYNSPFWEQIHLHRG